MKKIQIDDFCKLRSISSLKFSPDGKRICFVVSQADKGDNSYDSKIYELSDGKPRQLTSLGKESSFIFLDGDTLLFPGNREKGKEKERYGTVFYKLSLSGGEAVKALSFPIPVSKLMPLDNGDYVLVGTTVPGFEDLYLGDEKKIEEYQKFVKDNKDYEVIDKAPWWYNGAGFSESAYSSLYYYSKKTKKLRMLTDAGIDVSGAKLNKDKGEVWFFGAENKSLLPFNVGIDLYRMTLSDGKSEKILQNRDDFSVQAFEFGDSFVLLSIADNKFGLNTDGDFYKMSYEDHSLSLIAEYGEAIGSSVGSDVRHGGGYSMKMVGDTLYFISTIFDAAELYKLEDGKLSKLTDFGGSVDCFDVCGDDIRVVALKDMMPQEIYGVTGKRYTSLNARALAGKNVAVPEKLNFTTAGHEVHGFVYKPAGYTEGKKYPVIFDIHGGPKTVYGAVFYHEMQYWANLGYFVICCNPTGSDGRGEFSDIRGKYGTVDYEDLMAFCDEALVQYPDMDKNNVFETGGSYGGFMTNWIIGHTDRFAACASQRSISNWLSFWGVSDIGICFAEDQCAADPWGNPEKMWEHSPLKFADKCKTPTLFIHSFEDYRCPIDQGYQMYSALIKHGVESKMVLFKGENHELSRSGKPLHRVRRLDEITKWFEIHKR